MPRTYVRTDRNKRERLQAIIAEAKARNLEVPQDIIDQLGGVAPKHKWNLDEMGWFRGQTRSFKPNAKQLPFINSSAVFSALVAGRGCVGANTLVSGVPIADISHPHIVDTLYGKSLSTQSFLKGKDDLYRVRTQLGSEVLVTKHHRFLTPIGWIPLIQLQRGNFLKSL